MGGTCGGGWGLEKAWVMQGRSDPPWRQGPIGADRKVSWEILSLHEENRFYRCEHWKEKETRTLSGFCGSHTWQLEDKTYPPCVTWKLQARNLLSKDPSSQQQKGHAEANVSSLEEHSSNMSQSFNTEKIVRDMSSQWSVAKFTRS